MYIGYINNDTICTLYTLLYYFYNDTHITGNINNNMTFIINSY